MLKTRMQEGDTRTGELTWMCCPSFLVGLMDLTTVEVINRFNLEDAVVEGKRR